jgi:hypothetical protein
LVFDEVAAVVGWLVLGFGGDVVDAVEVVVVEGKTIYEKNVVVWGWNNDRESAVHTQVPTPTSMLLRGVWA